MKNIKIYCLISLALFSLAGCIKNVDITSPGEEITIVYGLIDVQQTKHYIRIEKAFLDKNKSALVMAKESDSIYYANILDVTITDLANGNIFTLSRVEGDTVGVPKDSGIFSNTPNILYSFDASLAKDHAYKLNVKNTKTGNEVSSQINLANAPKLLFPVASININIIDTVPSTVRWQPAPYDKIYDLVVRFRYTERNLTTSTTVSKYYDYIALKGVSDQSNPIERKINKSELYKRLPLYLSVDRNLERRVDPTSTIEYYLYAAGDEYDKYLQVRNAQGGISSLSYLPIYTNINNGLGLLSSRTFSKIDKITLNPFSLDSLSYGYYTKDLGFIR